MTQYEIWTMPGKNLVIGHRNACSAVANGRKDAESAMYIIESEIIRRLNILDEIGAEKEAED